MTSLQRLLSVSLAVGACALGALPAQAQSLSTLVEWARSYDAPWQAAQKVMNWVAPAPARVASCSCPLSCRT